MPEKATNNNTNASTNTRTRDNSSKVIFEDPILCAQFLRGYLGIPLLSEVQPEDIEDVTERFLPMFSEERDSDVVKRVRLKKDGTPCFFISLIEHKSSVDYNVVMQIFRYMAFIWEDYEKEQEKLYKGISRTKGFQYPPILPVIFYDGPDNWTAPLSFHDKILCSDVLGEYIPDYRCLLMQLKNFTNEELMKKRDELSFVMLMDKLQEASDFTRISKEIGTEYLEGITEETPEYLLKIMARVITMLLLRINVPYEEAADFAEQVKERKMGELFANFKAYDVQATRREAREKGRAEGRAEGWKEAQEDSIRILVETLQECGETKEAVNGFLMKKYNMDTENAEEGIKKYWKEYEKGTR